MRRIAVCMLVSLGVLTVGCSTPDRNFVLDERTQVFVKVPPSWHIFGQDELPGSSGLEADTGSPVVFRSAFAADVNAGVPQGLEDFDSSSPVGYTVVLLLDENEQDTVSMASLRNKLLPIDAIEQEDPQALELVANEVLYDRGFRGQRVVFDLRSTEDLSDPYGHAVRLAQSFYLGPTGSVAYYLIVGCTVDCYERDRGAIDDVIQSWSVYPP
jgi:hypothetical protein